MLGHDIIVVGASAGGVEALIQLVNGLPSDLPAALFIVVHVPPWSKSLLPDILNDAGFLRASHPSDGEAILHGRIYVAPPDYHLIVKRGYIRLVQGLKENGFRPAVDPLFRTAAKAYGPRVVGVVLSGILNDGTAGLINVKSFGGVAVVQNPESALFSGMPSSAVENVEVDHILPLSSIAPLLVRLANEPAIQEGTVTLESNSELDMEPDIVERDEVAISSRGNPETPAVNGCPDYCEKIDNLENQIKAINQRLQELYQRVHSGLELQPQQLEEAFKELHAAVSDLEHLTGQKPALQKNLGHE